MNLISTIKLVYRTLLARKGRSFLTILGIVIGVAGVIIIIALGAGAQSLVLSQVNKLGSDLLSIQPGKSNEKGPPSQAFGIVVTTLVKEDAEALRDPSRVPHAVGVMGGIQGSDTLVWQNKDTDVTFSGVEYTYTDIVSLTMEEGRFISEEESKGSANVIVIGSQVRDELFGETNPLGQVVKIKNVPFQVIGVVAKRGSFMFQNQDKQVFIPLGIAQKQLVGINYLQSITIKVDSADNMDQTISDVKQVLSEQHRIKRPEDEDFTVRNIADAIKIFTTVTDALRLFLLAMASIALVVGGIGILNIMMVTVAERTREIGLRKAVGATNSAIRNQFLLESGILTSLGGIIGIIVGVVVSYLAAVGARMAGLDWEFIVSPLSIVLAVGISIVTGVIFGIYPAIRASKLDPIEALRYE